MTTPPPTEDSGLLKATTDLVAARGRPCLIVISGELECDDLRSVRRNLRDAEYSGPIDLLLHGPGGDLEVAFKITRDIRRQCAAATAFVPRPIKSAMTLIALGADELVMGDYGELGPLDTQACGRMRAAFPLERSTLERVSTLDVIEARAAVAVGKMLETLTAATCMRPEDACPMAVRFAVDLYRPLVEQVHPTTVGFTHRALTYASDYLERVLRRYRPALQAELRDALVRCLVHGYPDHGFVIDREELTELGVPVRSPTETELPAFRLLEDAVRNVSGRGKFIELVLPSVAEEPAAS